MKPRTRPNGYLLLALAWMSACAPTCPPIEAPVARAERTRPVAPKAVAVSTIASGPKLSLVPEPLPEAALVVTLEVSGVPWTSFTIAEAPSETIASLEARDDRGPLEASISSGKAARSTSLRLARAPEGRLKLSYRVRASTDPMATLQTVVVADDRFRSLGGAFVPVPDGAEDRPFEITVNIDGHKLAAPHAMSSLGMGTTRTHKATFRALAHGMYLAGTLGSAVFNESAGERDEVGWLGYTAFDPRPAAAEIAQIRTALREKWKGGGEPSFAVAFVSTVRSKGSFNVAALAGSAVVHLGPNEPWSPSLRASLTQALARPWFGGELRVATREGHDAEGTWFTEGVARFSAVRLLAELGLYSPNDTAEWVSSLLAAQALSPFRGKPRSEVADKAKDDSRARAHLGVMGALHAVRTWTAYAKASAGTKSLDAELLLLMRRGRTSLEAGAPITPFSESVWVGILERNLGAAEAKAFEDSIVRGAEVILADGTLGPCFRAEITTSRDVEVGFDLSATLDARARTLVRLEQDGVAARAGAEQGDALVSLTRDEKDHVKLVVTRNGHEVSLAYEARARTARSKAFRRVRGKSDAECGPLL